jgi:hypothetical protein
MTEQGRVDGTSTQCLSEIENSPYQRQRKPRHSQGDCLSFHLLQISPVTELHRKSDNGWRVPFWDAFNFRRELLFCGSGFPRASLDAGDCSCFVDSAIEE